MAKPVDCLVAASEGPKALPLGRVPAAVSASAFFLLSVADGPRYNTHEQNVMKTSWLPTCVPAALALLGVLLLGLWIRVPTSEALTLRAEGRDGTPRSDNAAAGGRPEAAKPVAGPGRAADIPGVWSGFRGPHRDAICDDGTRLARTWPPAGPPVLWQIELGEGYASAAISGGRAFVLDYDDKAQADTMRCLSLADGREIWRNSYPAEVTRNHGMSRTVPAIAGDAVISIGPRCHVACWDGATGNCRWLLDMVRDFGAVERQWYAGQCPLVDGSKLILAPCGPDVLLLAVDCLTGRELWRTPNPRRWRMSHASVMPMECAGRKMYVYCGDGGTVGVSEDGKVLWDETAWVENFATAPSPLPLPGGRIFLCSGYDAVGAMMLQLKENAGALAAETAFTLKRKEFNSEHQTPIFYQGHIYAVRKNAGGPLVCLDLDGKERWNSGDRKFEHGPYLIADGVIFVLSGDGLLATAEATPDAYRPLAQFHVFQGATDAWGPMAMVAGRLVVRDLTRMACLDVRAAR